MDNAQKAIMIGVGLFITIIIISAVLLITNLGTDLIDDAAGEISGLSDTLKNELVRTYDGKTLKGSELLDCIEKYAGSDFALTVTGATSKAIQFAKITPKLPTGITADDYKVGGIVAISSSTTKTTSMKSYADAVNTIVASDMYKTAVVYNSAGRLLGIAAIKI